MQRCKLPWFFLTMWLEVEARGWAANRKDDTRKGNEARGQTPNNFLHKCYKTIEEGKKKKMRGDEMRRNKKEMITQRELFIFVEQQRQETKEWDTTQVWVPDEEGSDRRTSVVLYKSIEQKWRWRLKEKGVEERTDPRKRPPLQFPQRAWEDKRIEEERWKEGARQDKK